MRFRCRQSVLRGAITIPASKSHTIRAVTIASLANGRSVIHSPLVSADTRSAVAGFSGVGADVDAEQPAVWCVRGVDGRPAVRRPTVDVGNSGTTLRILLGIAGLLPRGQTLTITGDEQLRRRPAGPLLEALNALGAAVASVNHNGCAPFRAGGHLAGGAARLTATSSQYVTSLLLACPLADRETELDVPLLNEKMYVQMTLDWLTKQGIDVEHDQMCRFRIPGGQQYLPFEQEIPGDFSSATFFFGAGALAQNDVRCCGLDMSDSQPDKAVADYLDAMGAEVTTDDKSIRVQPGALRGIEIDMNETPDALPVMAVLGCFAQGETKLRNVEQARQKETDRIAVMARELTRLGADIAERPDGLIIRESELRGTRVDGHGDHRVVMALALAGMHCPGTTEISGAEAAGITFPEFDDLMRSLGAELETSDD